jgi:hypothetical protein
MAPKGATWALHAPVQISELNSSWAPEVRTAISPVGSTDATRFVFRLCLLLPLVNSHTVYNTLTATAHATYYIIQLYLVYYGHALYGIYGTPAFIQHVLYHECIWV